MLVVLQRRAGQFEVAGDMLFGDDGRPENGAPERFQGLPAKRGPAESQHAGGEEDEDPGVDDGVDGDEAQGLQVLQVGLLQVLHRGVDVNPDLKGGERAGGE